MCLVSNLIIPEKFKMPYFEKYKGINCPKIYLTMYYRIMVGYFRKEKFLIHYFQDRFSGASLEWHMQLKQSHVHAWKDLDMAFLKHYQYNLDMVPVIYNYKGCLKRETNPSKDMPKYGESWLLVFSHHLLRKKSLTYL